MTFKQVLEQVGRERGDTDEDVKRRTQFANLNAPMHPDFLNRELSEAEAVELSKQVHAHFDMVDLLPKSICDAMIAELRKRIGPNN